MLLLLISSFLFSSELTMTKDEFLKRFDQGSLSLEKAPVLPGIDADLIKTLIDSNKKEFPGFQDEMFYIAYVNTNQYSYMIMYEWYDRGCIYGRFELNAFKGKTMTPKEFADLDSSIAKSYEKIEPKYCEKALNLRNLSDKGLTRLKVGK